MKFPDSFELIKDLNKFTYLIEKSIFLFVDSPDETPKKAEDDISLYCSIKFSLTEIKVS